MLEHILSELSFSAPQLAAAARADGRAGHKHCVDAAQVHSLMEPLLKKQDLSKYVL